MGKISATPPSTAVPKLRRSRRSWLVGAALVAVALGVVGYWQKDRVFGKVPDEQGVPREAAEPDGYLPLVKVANPKFFPSFVISVEELANVEPFFHVELFARAAGPVRSVHFDQGQVVRRGDLLLEIDVPDLRQDVRQKENLVRQREAELDLAVAKVEIARSAIMVTRQTVAQRHAEANAAQATREYRQKVYERYTTLAARDAVTEGVVDEQLRDLKAAQAAYEAAVIAEAKASADTAETEASLNAALADVRVKAAAVQAARGDLDMARLREEFTRIRAPFSGVIGERRVDPGAFVQNATSSRSDPLMTLARTDLVTVSTRVPDRFAPWIREGTPAVLTFTGRRLRSVVSRTAPVIDARDRSLVVEIDLFNDAPESYPARMSEQLAPYLGLVSPRGPVELSTAFAAIVDLSRDSHKGSELLPPLPVDDSKSISWRPLMPGQTGTVELLLDRQDALLVPSSAVFSRGGKRYLFLRQGDRVRLASAAVRFDDGKLVRALVKTSDEISYRELTPNDQIVLSGQSQLSDGERIRPTPATW